NAMWQWVGWRRRRASGVARLEIERGAVDAIPEAGGLGRAIWEDVAEVGLAAGAAYLRAAHEERAVLMLAAGARVRRLVEAWPAGAGVELGVGGKQRLAATHAHVEPRALLFVERRCS